MAIRRRKSSSGSGKKDCDLIAMTSHGHRFFGDIFHGSTITEVRHRTHIPIFLVRAEKTK